MTDIHLTEHKMLSLEKRLDRIADALEGIGRELVLMREQAPQGVQVMEISEPDDYHSLRDIYRKE